MPKIDIPTALRGFTDEKEVVEVTGQSVKEALLDLIAQYPSLESNLFNDGKLRSYVNIYINREDVRYLDGEDTKVEPDDVLMILPAIAGGTV